MIIVNDFNEKFPFLIFPTTHFPFPVQCTARGEISTQYLSLFNVKKMFHRIC